jgi:hypothetical protein
MIWFRYAGRRFRRDLVCDRTVALNHTVRIKTVGKMLTTPGYSRQVNRKTKEGSHHPDRDGQLGS